MIKSLWIFTLSFLGIFVIDQNIKSLFLDGFSYAGECISLMLTFNKGVAFSMFSFIGSNLKYIQLLLILTIMVYFLINKESFKRYSLALGLLLGAGCSNIYDRFIHGGVVDYVYWHCGFEFAIFNFADVIIDLSVLIILYINIKKGRSMSAEKTESG